MWTLAEPLALLLLPLPLLAVLLLPPARGVTSAMILPETVLASAEAGAPAWTSLATQRLLPGLIWALLVLALAGPQRLEPRPALAASGRDIVLAIDLSGSMERDDFELDGRPARRVDAVRRIAREFVLRRSGDRVGMVVFGDHSYFAAPPTFDVVAVARAIDGMTIGIAGRSTAISYGLGLAMKRLDASMAPSKVIVLLSDGTNTAGAVLPEDAASLAAELGIRIHTIALGPDALSDKVDLRNVVDDVTLRAVAEASGGAFFRVRSTADLAAVGRRIDAMETSPTRTPPIEVWRSFWSWPATAALLLGLGLLAAEWRRR